MYWPNMSFSGMPLLYDTGVEGPTGALVRDWGPHDDRNGPVDRRLVGPLQRREINLSGSSNLIVAGNGVRTL